MTSVICPVRLARASASWAGVTVTWSLGRQLQHELVADLGVEVVGHERGRGRRVVAGVLALAGPVDRRQLLLRRCDDEVRLGVQVALVGRAAGDRVDVRVQRLLADGRR